MAGAPRILVLNIGGTSTKVAIFSGERCHAEASVPFHPGKPYANLADEVPDRTAQVRAFLAEQGIGGQAASDHASFAAAFDIVASRGGILSPLPAGVTRVNEAMLSDLRENKFGAHASNLSAQVAHALVGDEVPIVIVDPIVVDEFDDVVRISGVPGIARASRLHTLNIRAVAKRAASELGKPFAECSFAVAHLGSGFSIAAIERGRIKDVTDAQLGEGPFSVNRAGVLPLRGLMKLCYSMPENEVKDLLSNKSGFQGYLGTSDFREVEARIDAGDAEAKLVYDAMVYQVAKNAGAYWTALKGRGDAILLTGGMTKSERLVRDLREYLDPLARVMVFPGEDEMGALARGALAALSGEEPIRKYPGGEPE
ncbi:MAG: butyrate kinase [bacterium]|jgi:butyrate kinase